jgi:DNA-directed RNA polymerase specialized sigma subunit
MKKQLSLQGESKMQPMERWQKDILLWKKWKANPTPENQKELLKSIDPIINSEVQKQLGTIPPVVLKLKAKALVLKALPKYTPGKSRLNTFIVHQLAPLKRANMKAQNIVRLPENTQLKVRSYLDARQNLEEKLNREPTSLEMADHLAWKVKDLHRMERQFHSEAANSSLIYEGASAFQGSDFDLKVDLVYRSLNPRDQLVFEYSLGYGGKPKLSNNAIASRLKVSAAFVSQRKKAIMKDLKKAGV